MGGLLERVVIKGKQGTESVHLLLSTCYIILHMLFLNINFNPV